MSIAFNRINFWMYLEHRNQKLFFHACYILAFGFLQPVQKKPYTELLKKKYVHSCSTYSAKIHGDIFAHYRTHSRNENILYRTLQMLSSESTTGDFCLCILEGAVKVCLIITYTIIQSTEKN